jgi:hypothetical protein
MSLDIKCGCIKIFGVSFQPRLLMPSSALLPFIGKK